MALENLGFQYSLIFEVRIRGAANTCELRNRSAGAFPSESLPSDLTGVASASRRENALKQKTGTAALISIKTEAPAIVFRESGCLGSAAIP
jgi:hypothetical protein